MAVPKVSPRKRKRRTKSVRKPAVGKKPGAASARQPKSAENRNPAFPANGRIGEQFEALVSLQEKLRAPGGCPWDGVQTHESLRTYLLEEAYEVLEAIDNGDPGKLSEELGDLLLQVVFHAELAREAGRFDISGVIRNIHDKLVRRHPHVFGEVRAHSAEHVESFWEQLKAGEKLAQSAPVAENQFPPSVLDGIPRGLPALLEAHQLGRRAARVGFDWQNAESIFDKLDEEAEELRTALPDGEAPQLEEELGDLLFVLVNLSRHLKIDPEVALLHANRKFKSRFQEMESSAQSNGQSLADLSLEELEVLWEAAKERSREAVKQETKS